MDKTYKSPKKILDAALIKAAEADARVLLVSADSGPNSGFTGFIEKYPERFFEFGIMEQGVVGVAAGLATTGRLPVFCAPAPFVTGRPYEMFRIDLGYMHQNVKVIGRNAGFSYSDLGPTHYGLDDIGLVRMIPDVTILAPQDSNELERAFFAMLACEGPVYMRINSGSLPVLYDDRAFIIGEAVELSAGNDVAILATGSATQHVMEAEPALRAAGINPLILGMHTLSPIDGAAIERAAATGRIVTVEEHFLYGGLGTIVSDYCTAHCPVPVKKLGVPNIYATSGGYEDMLKLYGLDAAGIAQAVSAFMR